jgi:hypothetical protein
MTQNYFPYAVCVTCGWSQVHHAGDLRASQAHAHHHRHENEGHTTRIKTHHEFADILWTREFVTKAYGQQAWEMMLDGKDDNTRALVVLHDSGDLTLAECESVYACPCDLCVTNRQRRTVTA